MRKSGAAAPSSVWPWAETSRRRPSAAWAIINIILDPIFIFAFKWGMMGAAVATVIGQVVTAILAVWYLLHIHIIKPAASPLWALMWAQGRKSGSRHCLRSF